MVKGTASPAAFSSRVLASSHDGSVARSASVAVKKSPRDWPKSPRGRPGAPRGIALPWSGTGSAAPRHISGGPFSPATAADVLTSTAASAARAMHRWRERRMGSLEQQPCRLRGPGRSFAIAPGRRRSGARGLQDAGAAIAPGTGRLGLVDSWRPRRYQRGRSRGTNSVGRVPASQAGCRGFESRVPLLCSDVRRLTSTRASVFPVLVQLRGREDASAPRRTRTQKSESRVPL
jgi:hypothetical protein